MVSPRTFAAFTLVALASPAFADPTLRLYDVRDLASVLPARDAAGLPAPELGVKVNVDEREKIALRFAQMAAQRRMERSPEKPVEAESAVDDYMLKLCGALSLVGSKLADGVFSIEGEAAQHEQLTRLIQETFNLYKGRYEADISCYSAKAAEAPAIGAAPGEQPAQLRARTTLARRVPVLIEATESVSYVDDWTPVVSEQVVGFDPQTAVMEKGLRLTLTIGGTDAAGAQGKDQPVSFRLCGNIADIKVEDREIPGMSSGPPNAFLSLPHASVRSVNAEMNLVPGKPVVVAVVPGFALGEVIVVSATVRTLN